MIMWNELGISGGTAIVILIALYFVIKWAVKNGETFIAFLLCNEGLLFLCFFIKEVFH